MPLPSDAGDGGRVADGEYRTRLYRTLSDPSFSTDEMLDRLLALGREHLDVENAHVVEVDPDTNDHAVVAAAGSDVVQAGDRTDLGETFCRETITDDELLTVADVAGTDWADDPATAAWDIGCYIGSRVPVRDELFGTLCFVDREGRRAPFSVEERSFVDLLARSVSQVLEREWFEHTIRETRDLYELFVSEVSDYAIFVLDSTGQVATWNAGARNLKGYDEEEILGEHFSRFYPEADREAGRPAALLEEARRAGRVEDEGWRVRQDGSRFWALVSITALYDDDGELRGFGKVTRDLTERRKTQQRLEDERAFVERALNTLEDVFFVLDTDGGLARVNDRLLEVTGYDEDTLLATPPRELFAESDRERIDDAIAEVLATGETAVEATLLTSAGERRQYEFRARRLVDAGGDTAGVVGIGRDVTTRDLYQERLDVTQRLLRHNLRNELTVIRGWAESLAESARPEQREAVDRILERTDELVTLAEKSRVMAEMDLLSEQDATTVGPAAVVGSVLADLRASHPEADVEATVPDELGVGLVAADRFEVALGNAVENAIVHNPAAAPWVGVDLHHSEGMVRVVVEDDGPPIPATEQQVLDEGGEDPLRHGSGLGLWLIHWCVTTAGGDVTFEERAEGGNRITMVFPTGDG